MFAASDGKNGSRTAAAANAALRGETHNTGAFTLCAGSAEHRLADPRMGAGRVVLLSPLDAGAAPLQWWLDEAPVVKGGVTIRFSPAPEQDCRFNYAIFGIQRLAEG